MNSAIKIVALPGIFPFRVFVNIFTRANMYNRTNVKKIRIENKKNKVFHSIVTKNNHTIKQESNLKCNQNSLDHSTRFQYQRIFNF